MLKSIRHLDYVVLFCKDLSLMKNFYHQIMGFPIYLETPYWIEMRVGSVLLTLAQRGRPFEGSPIPEKPAAIQLAFRVAPQEVQSCYKELKEKQVEIIQAPQTIDNWKHRTLFFKDPEGNILEIYADIEISEEQGEAINLDYTKYLFRGKKFGKGRLVLAIIKVWVSENEPNTFSELLKGFPQNLRPGGLFVPEQEAREIYNNTGHKRHFLGDREILEFSDGTRYAISNQWGKFNIGNFINHSRKLGYTIEEIN